MFTIDALPALIFTASALLFIPAVQIRAVPREGAALHFAGIDSQSRRNAAEGIARPKVLPQDERSTQPLPRPVRFREVEGRGLLVRAWVNGVGPFTFAIDTGAGSTILTRRVANQSGVTVSTTRPTRITGLSGSAPINAWEAASPGLALDDRLNVIPSKRSVIVTETLAPGVDGVLDPVEALWPLGFELDMRRETLTFFDPRTNPLAMRAATRSDEAILRWLSGGNSRRPYVLLEDRVRVLLDTGSGFGLALTPKAAANLGVSANKTQRRALDVHDVAGGSISALRVGKTTVRLGELVLRGVPTNLLSNNAAEAPALLGREALRPFKLTFDPLNRIIRIVVS